MNQSEIRLSQNLVTNSINLKLNERLMLEK